MEAIKPLARATRRLGADGTLGGFGAVFDLAALKYRDPLLVATTDGVGTKLKLAIETRRFETVGIDLVAMCVNDLVVQGAEPLFFLDYYATGRLDVDEAAQVIAGIAGACREAGCTLIGGETAEMPGMYVARDFDLAGFAVGIVERDKLVDGRAIVPGDVVLGLHSSGPHSNGYTLIRRLVEERKLSYERPAPFDPSLTLGEALLTPTRIYVRACLDAVGTGGVKGMAHITGGGFYENVPRCLPEGATAEIDIASWRRPAIFDWLQSAGRIAPEEMARTFNCGIGMAMVVDAEAVTRVESVLDRHDLRHDRVGRIVPRIGEAKVRLLNLEDAWKS